MKPHEVSSAAVANAIAFLVSKQGLKKKKKATREISDFRITVWVRPIIHPAWMSWLPPKVVVQEEYVTVAPSCSPSHTSICHHWIKDVRGHVPALLFDGPVVHEFL